MPRGPDPTFTEKDILLFMVQSPDPAFTAGEIGEEFDRTRQWADDKLEEMAEKGYVKSKNPGGRSKFYWVTTKGQQFLFERRDTP